MQGLFSFFNMRGHRFLPPLKGVGFRGEKSVNRRMIRRQRLAIALRSTHPEHLTDRQHQENLRNLLAFGGGAN